LPVCRRAILALHPADSAGKMPAGRTGRMPVPPRIAQAAVLCWP
jgi:hypothetical protein